MSDSPEQIVLALCQVLTNSRDQTEIISTMVRIERVLQLNPDLILRPGGFEVIMAAGESMLKPCFFSLGLKQ
jgi:ABC-type Fe3+-hydroxamate transport system substrate-binding protein